MNGGGCQPRTQRVILRNMRKRTVALGLIDMSRPPINAENYLVVTDVICLPSESLFEGEGTFKDVTRGDKIMWPQHYVWLVASGDASV
ncbi:hypothetical protein MKX03_032956 [Papaver bracteatum]|nr:hypothetical protein MKX03_032956 [Papaver bracteatum]